MEAPPTAAEPAEEEKEEENVEKKENPHIPRHIGVPVMGMDLMAEMKARQERMAVKKVGGAHGSTCLAACVCVCVCVCVWSAPAAGGGATCPTLSITFIMIKALCLCFQSELLSVQEKLDGDKGEFFIMFPVLD